MNKLEKDFLERSITGLENLSERFRENKDISQEFIREAFRLVHTIKGTSQTFGFSAISQKAHKFESFLKDENLRGKEFNNSFLFNLTALINTLKLDRKKTKTIKSKVFRNNTSFTKYDSLKNYSSLEKQNLDKAIENGKKIFYLNIFFDIKSFASDFKLFRNTLEGAGEIIAGFPNSENTKENQYGFQICFASELNKSEIIKIAIPFKFEISEQKLSENSHLYEVLESILSYGKSLAKNLGKKIKFKISSAAIFVPEEKIPLIFEILTHLIRNAVDHAIETKSENEKNKQPIVEINLTNDQGLIKISVKDTGKGIEVEKIRAEAIKKNLISPDIILTEKTLLDLIFLHEFSTADELTEVSGRGVGLDAVKKMVENASGKINVKSRRGFGTSFEIFLPQ